jgi:hypothetical protein
MKRCLDIVFPPALAHMYVEEGNLPPLERRATIVWSLHGVHDRKKSLKYARERAS